MGYNKSIGPVRRMREYLDRLNSTRDTIRFASGDPRSLAYKLREACVAAQEHDQFEEYHDLRELFQFEEKRDAVVARYLGEGPPKTEKHTEPESTQAPPEEMVITEAETLEAVVGAALKLGARADQLRFPNATLLDQKKEKLHQWTQGRDWQFIDQEEAGTTLTKREVPDDIIWRPDETSTGDGDE